MSLPEFLKGRMVTLFDIIVLEGLRSAYVPITAFEYIR